MSTLRNPSTGDVYRVPDELDAMYISRGWQRADAVSAADLAHPAALAPAGATGDPVPLFDPAKPLQAGPAAALDNIESIKGEPLEESLKALSLDTKGTADEKRDRLAERLNEEINDA